MMSAQVDTVVRVLELFNQLPDTFRDAIIVRIQTFFDHGDAKREFDAV